MAALSLTALLASHRVLVCAGCGGVGKTSVAAALSVAAASRGHRVLALTIDPAKRLAESLGVDAASSERQYVSLERLNLLGIAAPAQLSVMVLDPSRTLKEMVQRLAPSQASYERIVTHPLYKHLSNYLAGANEYMAMEKVLSVLSEQDYDLLVLDTPPTRHALDFLRAPERLTDAIEGPVMKAFVKAVEGSKRFSLDWVAKGTAAVIRSLAKFTGAGMLEQVASLIGELNAIFGGFRERAQRVSEAFREPSFGYLLVTRANPSAMEDTLHFMRALASWNRTAAGVLINRVYEPLTEQEAADGLQELAPALTQELSIGVNAAIAEHLGVVAAQELQIRKLAEAPEAQSIAILQLPHLPHGISGLNSLKKLANVIGAFD